MAPEDPESRWPAPVPPDQRSTLPHVPPPNPWGPPQWAPPAWPPPGPVYAPYHQGTRVGVGDKPFLEAADAPPATKRDAWAWIFLALAGFVVGQIFGGLVAYVVAAIKGQAHDLSSITSMAVPPEWYIVSSLFGIWVGFLGAPFLATKIRGTGRFFADLGVRFRWIDLCGLAIGFGGQILVGLLYLPFHVHNLNGPTQKLTGGSGGGGFLVIALFTVIGAPFMEELFFRGLLLRGLARLFTRPVSTTARRNVGIGAAVVLDGLLFGAAHAEWVQFAGLAAFGMVLAFVSYKTGRLGMNIVSHATFNLVAVIAIEAMRSGH